MPKIMQLYKSQFLRQNAIFFTGTLLVSVFNYLYYPVMGRLLDLHEYGEVQVLVSFFLQLTMILLVITQVTTNIVANNESTADKQRVIFELEKLAMWAGVGILVVGFACSWLVASSLKFQSPLPFVLLLLAFVITIPFSFRSGFLRARQKFVAVSIGSVVGSAGKVIIAALLVLLGLGTNGAMGGLVVAQILALFYTIYAVRRLAIHAPVGYSYISAPSLQLLLPELKYFGLFLVGTLAVTLMYSVDIILVKYYFTPEEAGLYAAVATIARIVFFLTVSIGQVLMPMIKLNASAIENRRILLKSSLLVGGIGGAAWLFIALFPLFVMQILMGEKYMAYGNLLPELSFALFLISLLNLFVAYHLALRHYGVGIVAVGGACATVLLIVTSHDSLAQVVRDVLLGSIAALMLLAVWLAVDGYRRAVKRRVRL